MASIFIRHLSHTPVYATMVAFRNAQQPRDTIVALVCTKQILLAITPHFLSKTEINEPMSYKTLSASTPRNVGKISERIFSFFLSLNIPTLRYINSISLFCRENRSTIWYDLSTDQRQSLFDNNRDATLKPGLFKMLQENGCDHIQHFLIEEDDSILDFDECLEFLKTTTSTLENFCVKPKLIVEKRSLLDDFTTLFPMLAACRLKKIDLFHPFEVRYYRRRSDELIDTSATKTSDFVKNYSEMVTEREKEESLYMNLFSKILTNSRRSLHTICLPASNKLIKAVSACCPALTSATWYSSADYISRTIFANFGDSCPYLTALNMNFQRNADLFSGDFVNVPRDMIESEDESLIELDGPEECQKTYMSIIANHFKNLEILITSNNALSKIDFNAKKVIPFTQLQDAEYRELFRNCSKLKIFKNIGNDHTDQFVSVNFNLSDAFLKVIEQYGTALEVMELHWERYTTRYVPVEPTTVFSMDAYDSMVKALPNLRTIKFTNRFAFE